MRSSQRKMYIGHGRVCVCVSLAAVSHYCTDPDVTWENVRRCHLVVHYWAHFLQSVHKFNFFDSIAPNVKCRQVLVLAHCVVDIECYYQWGLSLKLFTLRRETVLLCKAVFVEYFAAEEKSFSILLWADCDWCVCVIGVWWCHDWVGHVERRLVQR